MTRGLRFYGGRLPVADQSRPHPSGFLLFFPFCDPDIRTHRTWRDCAVIRCKIADLYSRLSTVHVPLIAEVVTAQTVSTGSPTIREVRGCWRTWDSHRRLTFPESRGLAPSGQLTRFFFVSLVGLAINLPVFLFVDSSLRPYLGHHSYKVAKLFAVGVVLTWNFLANRLWTFSD